MCKEMLVIPVNTAVGPKKYNRKKWREEEERHMGSLTPSPPKKVTLYICVMKMQKMASCH
jgi:hypothetical protein